MTSVVLCEKPSQAKQVLAAVGEKYGRVVALRGHVTRLKEPYEVNPEWKDWGTDLLWTGTLYPLAAPTDADRLSILKNAVNAMKGADHVIISSDPDREGQVLAQDVLVLMGFKGRVSRVSFLSTDKASIAEAFKNMESNDAPEWAGAYAAGSARRQADHIINLMMTRVCSSVMLPEGMRGRVSIGRVRTPVLEMIVKREIEIRNFKPQNYYEVMATVKNKDGSSATLACTKLPRGASLAEEEEEEFDDAAEALGDEGEGIDGKIANKAAAEALAASVQAAHHKIKVTKARKKTSPPKLFDAASLQAAASTRFKYAPTDTMGAMQRLYDTGILTYPRTEATQLTEDAIPEAKPLVDMLLKMPRYSQFANVIQEVEVRRGKTGHYWNGIKEKYSHFAIVPNFAGLADMPGAVAGLNEFDFRIFDMVARRFLAAHAPDYVYDQTVLSFEHQWAPEGRAPITWTFSKTGNVPVIPGWKAIEFPGGAAEKEKDKEDLMDPFTNGEDVACPRAWVESKLTRPPSRYTDGAIPTLMKQVWRTIPKSNPEARAKFKEIEGIGRPSTRDRIVKELTDVNQITVTKSVVTPTNGGIALIETLWKIAPNVCDAIKTAQWESLFTRIEKGEVKLYDAVKRLVEEADKDRKSLIAAGPEAVIQGLGSKSKPSPKMVEWVKRMAASKNIQLPKEVLTDMTACSAFIEEHRPRDAAGNPVKPGEGKPSETQIALARRLADENGLKITADMLETSGKLSAFIDEAMKSAKPSEKQIALAQRIAEENGIELTNEVMTNRNACSKFIDKHFGKSKGKGGAKGGSSSGKSGYGGGSKGSYTPRAGGGAGGPPSDKQIALVERIAKEKGIEVPADVRADKFACSKFIDANMPKR